MNLVGPCPEIGFFKAVNEGIFIIIMLSGGDGIHKHTILGVMRI
jgi:hypothetical protein